MGFPLPTRVSSSLNLQKAGYFWLLPLDYKFWGFFGVFQEKKVWNPSNVLATGPMHLSLSFLPSLILVKKMETNALGDFSRVNFMPTVRIWLFYVQLVHQGFLFPSN